MPHTINKTNQLIKTPISNHNRKAVWPVVDLAQARSPRSGERNALAQAADSRLGETTNRVLGVSRALA